MHSINPVAGEVYYLCMLLHDNHCRGKTSYEDMLIVPSGRQCETFKEVCFELGLLNDDREWYRIMEESAATKMWPQLRELFVIVLMFCLPSDPCALFLEFWETWTDDFVRHAEQRGFQLSEGQMKTMVLLDIELWLSSYEQRLNDFNLPVPTTEDMDSVEHLASTQPAIIREELDFQFDQLKKMVEERIPTLTEEQLHIFEVIMNAVQKEYSLACFIDARGGCGKTYLINSILAAVRCYKPRGCVALAMATTGIAANLLHLGRTFHESPFNSN